MSHEPKAAKNAAKDAQASYAAELLSKMDPEKKKTLEKLLQNPEAVQKILRTAEAQELLRKLGK